MPHFIFLGRSWQGILILPICHFHFVCEFVKCVKMHFCFRQQNLGPVFPYNFIFLLLVTEKNIASANNTTGLQCLLSGSVRSSPGVLHSELGGVCSPSGWWLLFFIYFVLTSHVNNPISLFHSPLPSLSFLILLFFLPFPSSLFRSSPSSWTTGNRQKEAYYERVKTIMWFLGTTV